MKKIINFIQNNFNIYTWLAIIVAIWYIYIIFHYSVNIPYSDDFDSVYWWLIKYYSYDNYQDKILSFFVQHNEHRIFLNHIVQFLIYKISGYINLRYMIFLWNIWLFFMIWFFYKIWTKLLYDNSKKLILFAAIVILRLSFIHWESSFFAMAVLSNMRVIALALFSFYFADKYIHTQKNIYLILSLMIWVLWLFTQWNWILIWLVVSFTFLFQKEYKKSIIYILPWILFIWLYFLSYKTSIWTWSNIDNIIKFITNPHYWTWPFMFLGSAFGTSIADPVISVFTSYGIQKWVLLVVPFLSGLVMSAYFLYILYRYYFYQQKINTIYIYIIIFLLANAILTSITRINFFVVTSRYSMYSLLSVTIFVAILFFEHKNNFFYQNLKYIKSFFVLTIIYNLFVSSIIYNVWLKPNYQNRINDIQNYQKWWNVDFLYISDPAKWKYILDESVKKWYYKITENYK